MSTVPPTHLDELELPAPPPYRFCAWCGEIAVALCDQVVDRIGNVTVMCGRAVCAKHRSTAHHVLTADPAGGARLDTSDRRPDHSHEGGGL